MKENMTQTVFVVLGATGGVGNEVAHRLRERDARVFLGARNPGRLEELAGGLDSPFAIVDAGNPGSVEACIQTARETWGRVDGVVNCMGTLLLKPAHLTTEEEWNTTIQVNLSSCFAALRAATQTMTKDGGSIVFVSSAAARTGLPNHDAIAAAKAGIEGLVRSGAASYGHRGIRVNAVSPGLVRTPLTERITSSEKALESSRRMHVLGRIGETTDIAAAIVWLLDPAQSWITGQVLGVDGGLGTVRSRG